ncbi:EamA family transporter [Legionella sp. CNM-4043-24]|uniref:EamA family transporter n=1 Tax=Legionella sp. CNM-4043-24 TaxID=3421646 RepID=UPI00403B0F3D
MPLPHLLLALLVAVIWGVNFIFVSLSLQEVAPLLLCALRFLLASVPALFFVKFPSAPFRIVAAYGLLMFALQFSLLFVGLQAGMTAGMASMIMQVQVFFSMFFAAVFLKERPTGWQIMGALVSFSGIGMVAGHFDSNLSFTGFSLILAAAATWGLGNLIIKKTNNVNMMALTIWGSFIACIPMFVLSLLLEGPARIVGSFEHLGLMGAASIAYIVYVSTLVGYGLWNWLVSRYPVGVVVPFTLLVPIIGITCSILILGEPFHLWKLEAGALVIGGLGISLFGARFLEWLKPGNETPLPQK